MKSHDTIIILDYGSQYAQLLARRVREAKVYCVIVPWNAPLEEVVTPETRGFILSGSHHSVYDDNAPILPEVVVESGLPILGVCYGMQLFAHRFGGQVAGSSHREYGPANLHVTATDNDLFRGWQTAPESSVQSGSSIEQVWMSHGDKVESLPPTFQSLAHTDNSPFAAAADITRPYYALQFHPEVVHTPQGRLLISNFVHRICHCGGDWTPANFIDEQVSAVREQVNDGQVVLGLSGGVDSAVAAALIHRAIGDQLTCIFVDTGLMRANEAIQVVETFQREQGIRLIAANAVEEYLEALAGVTEPEAKRRIIGEKFVRIFEREAGKLGKIDFLAQGTIYPDVIESAGKGSQQAQLIKTHHNVGGLPDDMDFELVEPLRFLFKDEVRLLGTALGLPDAIVWRQPFPGPGLAVRCLGEITWARVESLRKADAIFLEELDRANLLREGTQQAFAVLLPVRSVGVMGDGRTYQEVIALRAITTDDFMTADWARLPYDLLAHVSRRIVNEVAGVNRVVLDITSKPPGTIEWE